MADFLEAASDVLAVAQRRVEIAAQNVANMTTPGYRRRLSFEQFLGNANSAQGALPTVSTATDFTAGKQSNTGNPYDIAIMGNGFFMVQSGAQALYTRDGQFKRDADGRVVTQRGLPVQLEGGGDLVVSSDNFQVKPDGSVVEGGDPVGKLAIVDFTNRSLATPTQDGLFTSPPGNVTAVDKPSVRQATLESSNVSTADEMLTIMGSLRSAEAGQKLMNVYDDLMGRVMTSFGQN